MYLLKFNHLSTGKKISKMGRNPLKLLPQVVVQFFQISCYNRVANKSAGLISSRFSGVSETFWWKFSRIWGFWNGEF